MLYPGTLGNFNNKLVSTPVRP